MSRTRTPVIFIVSPVAPSPRWGFDHLIRGLGPCGRGRVFALSWRARSPSCSLIAVRCACSSPPGSLRLSSPSSTWTPAHRIFHLGEPSSRARPGRCWLTHRDRAVGIGVVDELGLRSCTMEHPRHFFRRCEVCRLVARSAARAAAATSSTRRARTLSSRVKPFSSATNLSGTVDVL